MRVIVDKRTHHTHHMGALVNLDNSKKTFMLFLELSLLTTYTQDIMELWLPKRPPKRKAGNKTMALSSLVSIVKNESKATPTQQVKKVVDVVNIEDLKKDLEELAVNEQQQAQKQQAQKVSKTIEKVKRMQEQEDRANKTYSKNPRFFVEELNRELRYAELWFGNPGTGKSTMARRICDTLLQKDEIEGYSFIRGHEEMTVMSMLKTTKTDEDGNWKFLLNRAFNIITDQLQKPFILVIDEFNTLPVSVMKALQPIMDDTSGTFEFEEKTYVKNPNVRFILTMNHKDIGTSTLPDAIVDRVFPKFFRDLTIDELSQRTGVPSKFIQLMERIRNMFAHLGNIPEFHRSVRQLKNIKGLSKEDFKEYIISELELAHVEWEEAIAISPEFENFIEEYGKLI